MSIQYHDETNRVTVAADNSTVENTDQPSVVQVTTGAVLVTVEDTNQPNLVEVSEDVTRVVVEDANTPHAVQVTEDVTRVTVIASIGAIGPQGPEGPQGPQGLPGAVQSITASSPLSVVGSISPNISLSGMVGVANGGTGASSLTGYVYGNGTSAFTASPTIPNSAVSGLGTMALQNATSVTITGGTLTGVAVPTAGAINWNGGAAPMAWDTTDSTLTLALNANVNYHLGAQELVRVMNRTGTTIAKGKAVYILGAHGDRPEVALADASGELTAATTLGVTAESIGHTAEGFVCITGILRGLNTNALTEGALVWLSETAGELTSTRPTQPAHGVFMGLCVRQAPGGAGILYVSVVNGQELEELHDVLITSPTAGQLFKRNAGNTLWVNASPGALSKTDDTNVTLTLGGSPSAALVNDASLTLGWTGQLGVTRGGTGASSLTGYVKGNGVSAMTAASTIPSSDITGLGTMSTQNATSVAITGGTISGIADLAVADGGTGASTAQAAMNTFAGAVTSGQYLRGNGSNVVMSAIQVADVPTLNQNTTGTAAGLSQTLAVSSGGTGTTSLTGYLVGNGASAFTAVSSIPGSAISGNIAGNAANVTGLVDVINGGTGVGSLTGLVKGNGTSAFTAATSGVDYAPATSGTAILYGNGSGGFSAVSIGANLSFTGGTLSATGGGGGGTVTAVTASAPLASSGGTTPDISFTGTLGVPNGGTGATSLTGYLVGNGGSAFTAVSSIPGSAISGNIAGNAANVTGTVAVGNGGTGVTSLAGYVFANGASAFTAVSSIPGTVIAGDIAGNAAGLTQTLSVSSGGTGATSLTGYLVGNGGSAFTAVSSIPGSAISGNIPGNAANVTGTVAVGNGGSGATSLTGYLVGNGASAFTAVTSIPGAAIAGDITGNAANVTGLVAVTNGGTGVGSLTGLVKGNGTSAFTAATSGVDYAPATSGTAILYGDGSGGFSAVSIGANLLFTGGTLSATGGGGSGTVTDVTASAPLASSGGTTPNISFTGTLGVANGGTGVTSLSGYLVGNGGSAFTAVSSIPGSAISGNIAGNAANVTGTVAVANGGSGATTLTGYLRGNGTSAFTASNSIPGSAISGNITGNAANVTGTVAVGNGGSGATTLTGYLRGNGTSAFTASNSIPGSAISGDITGNAANVTGTVAVGNGGSGATTLTGYLRGNGTSAFTASNSIPGSAISGNITGNAANVTGLVAVANGGTGVGSLTGLVKGNGTSAFTAATSGTDYAPATSGSAILYGSGAGGFSAVSIGANLNFSGGVLSATGSVTATSIGWTAPYVATWSQTSSLSRTDGAMQVVVATSTLTVFLYAANSSSGHQVWVKNASAGTITLDANASETIDGSTTRTIPVQYGALQLVCDGTSWHIV